MSDHTIVIIWVVKITNDDVIKTHIISCNEKYMIPGLIFVQQVTNAVKDWPFPFLCSAILCLLAFCHQASFFMVARWPLQHFLTLSLLPSFSLLIMEENIAQMSLLPKQTHP